MSMGEVTRIVSEGLFVVIKVSTPILMVSLVIGLVISIFQTATSIQEQTMTFVPKVLAVFITIIVLGNWMASVLTDYITDLWNNFSIYIR